MHRRAHYERFFSSCEASIVRVERVSQTISDRELVSELAGMLCVLTLAATENAIKAILVEFARECHPALLSFCENHFEKMNSRITIENLREYAKMFGASYEREFDDELKARENVTNGPNTVPVKQTYRNLTVWRHKFAHNAEKIASGVIPADVSLAGASR